MLLRGCSPKVISANIRRERRAGKPLKQAVAIALREARATGRGKCRRKLGKQPMATAKQKAAARRNIKKAHAALRRKKHRRGKKTAHRKTHRRTHSRSAAARKAARTRAANKARRSRAAKKAARTRKRRRH